MAEESSFNFVAAYRQMKARGVLGINARNANYVLKYNPRANYPLVDNKLKTKILAQQHSVAVPELYSQLHSEHDIKILRPALDKYDDFVIKPAQGAGGDGIMVITKRVQDKYRKEQLLLLLE